MAAAYVSSVEALVVFHLADPRGVAGLALAQLALSTLDLLFFSGSGASTLARELEPPRPWLDVGAN